MNGSSGGGDTNWGELILYANQAAMGWYSTVTQKPVQTGQPGSAMRNVFGADLSAGPTLVGQTASPLSVVLVLAIVVTGVVLLVRK